MKQLLTKYQIFTKLPPISHFHKFLKFKFHWEKIDQLLLPYKFYGKDM